MPGRTRSRLINSYGRGLQFSQPDVPAQIGLGAESGQAAPRICSQKYGTFFSETIKLTVREQKEQHVEIYGLSAPFPLLGTTTRRDHSMARNILRAIFRKRPQARLPRNPLVYLLISLGCMLLLSAGLFVYFQSAQQAQRVSSSRADLFMHSVVILDGALGWHQLCPALQAELPIDVLRNQAAEQKETDTQQNITFSMKYLGAQTQPKGGEMRFYLVTAKRPDGWQAQRMYIVRTQSTGCVEDVQNIDLPGEETT